MDVLILVPDQIGVLISILPLNLVATHLGYQFDLLNRTYPTNFQLAFHRSLVKRCEFHKVLKVFENVVWVISE